MASGNATDHADHADHGECELHDLAVSQRHDIQATFDRISTIKAASDAAR